jgi:glycosyltransferase involved in cell wall biosynthesis
VRGHARLSSATGTAEGRWERREIPARLTGVGREAAVFPDLIFVSMENWDDIWRRNQFLCAGLAKRFPSTRILFVGLPRDVSHAVRRGRLSAELGGRATVTAPGFDNITLTRPLKLAPASFAWGRCLNEAMMRHHVRRVAREIGIRDAVLWLNPHSAVHMGGRMGERAVVYDITDDWTSLTQSPRLTRLTCAQDAVLCRRADAVIVCSQRLLELKRDLAANLHLVPNGVDADHYEVVLDGTGPLPEETRNWHRPVLGYTGTLHPDRLDVPLLETVARGFRHGSIVLIGPSYLADADRRRLEGLGNVIFTGAVSYGRLPHLMRAFDVCIVPHRVTAFTESLNPIKLWEYLAAGKPTVATDVAGFREHPELVAIAADGDGFLHSIVDALRESPARQEARRTEARRHSWDARLDAVQAVIGSCLAATTRAALNVH